ncbi:MAG: hypothetical protein HQ556_12900 [Candidatus Marinimicrobia bacterium]|nr:hypothetical protein [Candidatus Neomarinimicrobiota bacterium]
MRKILLVSTSMIVSISLIWGSEMKVTALNGGASDWFGYSVSISGDYAIVGAFYEDTGGNDAGAAYIYYRDQGGADNWGQQAMLKASDTTATDHFGYSVSISGDYAIVGARYDDPGGITNAGAAYIFIRNGADWTMQQQIAASDTSNSDHFGCAVSISGDYAIVGADLSQATGSSEGAAYVFVRSGTSWTEQKKLQASDKQSTDYFGRSVAISGDYAIVGAEGEDTGGSTSGAAYLFFRNQDGANLWGQQEKISASNASSGDYFGHSVAISGDYAIVGAYYEDEFGGNAGAAYIFIRSVADWTQQTIISASDAQASDFFGVSVSISEDYALIGAYYEDEQASGAGAAYSYLRSGVTWTEKAKTTASDGQGDDYFGNSVAISGDDIIVAAYQDDDNGSSAGSAYIYSSSADFSLPVELSSFTASVDRNGEVLLSWITESEIENLGFILERRTTTSVPGPVEGWIEIASYLTDKSLAGQGNSTARTEYSYADESIKAGLAYEYRLADVSYTGEMEYHTLTVLVTSSAVELPTEYILQQNYPNPFNPVTTIRYGIPEESALELIIYDVRGAFISRFYWPSQPVGWHEFVWAGISDDGNAVNTGVYFCRLNAGSYSQIIKMVYLR